MLLTIDLKECIKNGSINFVGELLHYRCFIPKDQIGCYSTFELTPDFKKVEYESELGEKLLKFLNEDDSFENELYPLSEFIEDYHPTLYSNGEISIAWYWDGDGTLLFHTKEFTLINTDCKKKDYGWSLL